LIFASLYQDKEVRRQHLNDRMTEAKSRSPQGLALRDYYERTDCFAPFD